jgi:hypothetical protein
VGGFLAIGAGAELEIDIEGAVRGSEYGAIDARQAVLGGILGIDFTDFAPTADSEVFDLLRSGGADGIWGDFASLSFIGVQDGYSAVAGIELDGVEVYRVRLTRNSVPEPPSVALFLVALTMLAMTQWRGNAARSWRTASAKPQPRKP